MPFFRRFRPMLESARPKVAWENGEYPFPLHQVKNIENSVFASTRSDLGAAMVFAFKNSTTKSVATSPSRGVCVLTWWNVSSWGVWLCKREWTLINCASIFECLRPIKAQNSRNRWKPSIDRDASSQRYKTWLSSEDICLVGSCGAAVLPPFIQSNTQLVTWTANSGESHCAK